MERVRRQHSQSGQAAVEAALVMPLMVFLALGVIQLTLLQQARLFTEYAAFQAARAGIVWNGSNERMRAAVMFALAPTFTRTDSMDALDRALVAFRERDAHMAALPWPSPGPQKLNGVPLRGVVRVDTVNPANYAELGNVWKVRGGAQWEELDFDGVSGFPEDPRLQWRAGKFDQVAMFDADEDLYRRATVLSIRVRYWYEMKVPFANWIVFLSWFATNADVALRGAIDRPTLADENMLNRAADVDALESMAKGIDNDKGLPTATGGEMQTLWRLSTGALSLNGGNERRFFVPLSATYSMRMQSSFHRKWILHERPGWQP